MSVIEFDHVSKRFALQRETATTVLEAMTSRFRRSKRNAEGDFWALRDVSFRIEPGETVGIVGANGGGKSTTLKLISRVLEPTLGRIRVQGRIGALLELGAGFHPDLTGRENIYLNGSLLGLSREEIRRSFDEIVAFAELERFIDVPVKHYSSGMYVRLGFAVAIHTHPDILLVDEVLAVGDATFQRKSLERILELKRAGTTIVFVSHSAEMVRSLCQRAIWLDDGRVVADDLADVVLTRYENQSWAEEAERVQAEESAPPPPTQQDEHRWGTQRVTIEQVRILNAAGEEPYHFRTGEPLILEMTWRTRERVEAPVFGMAIFRSDGIHVTGPNTQFAGVEIPALEGTGKVTFTIPALPLLEGVYQVSVAVHNQADTEMYDLHDRLYSFRVLPGTRERYGVITVNGAWHVETI